MQLSSILYAYNQNQLSSTHLRKFREVITLLLIGVLIHTDGLIK